MSVQCEDSIIKFCDLFWGAFGCQASMLFFWSTESIEKELGKQDIPRIISRNIPIHIFF